MSLSVFERICAMLDTAGVVYELSHHAPVITSEEASRVRGVDMHTGAKALVMRTDKTKQYVLFVLPADLRLDKKKVKVLIGESVSFADDPATVTGCVRGSVPPFGSALGLTTYCDQRLADNLKINFNAGSLTDSVQMKYEDYLALERPKVVDIAEVP